MPAAKPINSRHFATWFTLFAVLAGGSQAAADPGFIAGDNDGAFDAINGFADMPAAFSNGYEFVLIKNAGHFLHREKPREFLSKLIQFLKE